MPFRRRLPVADGRHAVDTMIIHAAAADYARRARHVYAAAAVARAVAMLLPLSRHCRRDRCDYGITSVCRRNDADDDYVDGWSC